MIESLKKLSFFIKKKKFTYIIAISALLIVNIVGVLPPLIVGPAVDSITRGDITKKYLYLYVGALLLISAIDYVLTYTWAYMLFSNAKLLEKNLRVNIMKKILGMRQPFFEKFKSGDLMTRATEDLEAVQHLVGFGVLAFTDSVFYLSAIIIAMGSAISWKLTILCLLPLPVMALIINIIGKYIHKSYTDQQNAFDQMSNTVLEFVSGIKVVRSYVLEERTYDKISDITENVYKKSLKTEIISGSFFQLTKTFTAISYSIAIGYGAVLISRGEITLGDLIAFNVYLGYLIWPIFTMGEFTNIAQRGSASINRVFEILEEEDTKLDLEAFDKHKQAQEKHQDSGKNIIAFKDYTFRYPSSYTDNLKNINLSLKEGETLGIAGRTGAGKSTLIKQLLAEYEKGEGELLVFDQPIESMSRTSLMSDMAYVAQESILFFTTIKNNILFGKEDASDEEINAAIRQADLQRDMELFPEGLDTVVGERGVSVSGGQKQRISIARALIKNAKILILDDSLSAVDTETEHRIIENIKDLRKGKTTIISAHRLSALEHADQIIVLEDGKIMEQGSHEDLVKSGRWYKDQYKIQQMQKTKGGA